jgi:hypothetical protein
MWRQVELEVIQGRNIRGTTAPGLVDVWYRAGAASSDLALYCEIYVNSMLCGRTTVDKGTDSPAWREKFILSDLPPFENLEIKIWRDRRLFEPIISGTVNIPLSNFRRGEAVDGWFQLMESESTTNPKGFRVGELRLKIRVDEYAGSAFRRVFLLIL